MDVLTFLANSTVVDMGSKALVALFVVMLFTDRIIPRRTHLRETTELTASRDAWKAAYIKSEKARQELGNQLNKFLETARTSIIVQTEQPQKRTRKKATDDLS